jgi:hypothetical protein
MVRGRQAKNRVESAVSFTDKPKPSGFAGVNFNHIIVTRPRRNCYACETAYHDGALDAMRKSSAYS